MPFLRADPFWHTDQEFRLYEEYSLSSSLELCTNSNNRVSFVKTNKSDC